jgi:hypothetical protein
MISSQKNATVFADQTGELKEMAGEGVYRLVQSAMASGLTEFTTPTSADDEKRIDWKVRRWVVLSKSGEPTSFLVAYMELNAHFEILGPEIPLPARKGSTSAAA